MRDRRRWRSRSPPRAGAHAVSAPAAATALGPTSCPGAAIQPTQVITGEFASELQGSFVLLPFQVPAGTTAVRVKYCWDPPIAPFVRHTLDLGSDQARTEPGALYGPREFRGWGGSSHPDVTSPPRASRARRSTSPARARNVPGKTTRGFLPGPIARRRMGGRAGRRRRRHTGARGPGRQGGLARRDRAVERPGVRRRALRAGPYDSTAGQRRRGAGTPATCTSTPSTPRSATRP